MLLETSGGFFSTRRIASAEVFEWIYWKMTPFKPQRQLLVLQWKLQRLCNGSRLHHLYFKMLCRARCVR